MQLLVPLFAYTHPLPNAVPNLLPKFSYVLPKTGGLQDPTWLSEEGPMLAHGHATHTAPDECSDLNGPRG